MQPFRRAISLADFNSPVAENADASVDRTGLVLEGELPTLCEKWSFNASLTSLNLSENKLNDTTIECLAAFLKSNQILRILTLRNNSICNPGANSLGNALVHNATLTELDLTYNLLKGDCPLFRLLHSNRGLIVLNLSFNDLGSPGLQSLISLIQQDTPLRVLNLTNNKIQDGATELVETLKRSKMEEVTYDFNRDCEIVQAWQELKTEQAIKKLVCAATGWMAWGRCKVAVIGQARAGKTCTIKSLRNDGLDEKEESTASTAICTVERCDLQNWLPIKRKNQFLHAMETVFDSLPERAPRKPEVEQLVRELRSDLGSDVLGAFFDLVDYRIADDLLFLKICRAAVLLMHIIQEEKVRDAVLFGIPNQKEEVAKDFLSCWEAAVIDENICGYSKVQLQWSDEEFAALSIHLSLLRNLMEDQQTNQLRVFKTWRTTIRTKIGIAFNNQRRMENRAISSNANNASSSGSNDSVRLSVWDFGGQNVFYALHHIFLTSNAIYLCLFDLCKIRDCDREAESLIDFWVRSITIHAPKAKILLVGTHAAQLKPAEITTAETKLRERLKKHLSRIFEYNGKLFFPIDNKKRDNVITDLRAAIQQAVPQDYVHSLCPISWLRVLDKLDTLKVTENVHHLPLQRIEEIAAACNVAGSQVDEMLQKFHDFGSVVWFRDREDLRHVVTIEPQWLISALSVVICGRDHWQEDSYKDAKKLYDRDWNLLDQCAVASRRLLAYLWSRTCCFECRGCTHEKFLLALMKKMNLLCDWTGNELGANQLYLIPSLLKENPKPLVLAYSLSFIPHGFFDQLVCKLVNHCRQFTTLEPRLNRSSALMSLGTDQFELSQDIQTSEIKLQIIGTSLGWRVRGVVSSMMEELNEEVFGSNIEIRELTGENLAESWIMEDKVANLANQVKQLLRDKINKSLDLHEGLVKRIIGEVIHPKTQLDERKADYLLYQAHLISQKACDLILPRLEHATRSANISQAQIDRIQDVECKHELKQNLPRSQPGERLESLISIAHTEHPLFESALRTWRMEEISEAIEIDIPAMKSLPRVLVKMVQEYNGCALRIVDFIRATVICASIGDLLTVFAAFRKKFVVIRLKNQLTKMPFRLLANVMFISMVCEVQFVLEPVYAVAKKARLHLFYEVLRCKRSFLAPVELADFPEPSAHKSNFVVTLHT